MNLSEVPEGVPCEVRLQRYKDWDGVYIRYHKNWVVYGAGRDYYGTTRGDLSDGYVVVRKLYREDGDD